MTLSDWMTPQSDAFQFGGLPGVPEEPVADSGTHNTVQPVAAWNAGAFQASETLDVNDADPIGDAPTDSAAALFGPFSGDIPVPSATFEMAFDWTRVRLGQRSRCRNRRRRQRGRPRKRRRWHQRLDAGHRLGRQRRF